MISAQPHTIDGRSECTRKDPFASVSGEAIDTDVDEEESFRATSLVPFLWGERPEDHRQEAFAEFHGVRFFTTQRIVWDDQYTSSTPTIETSCTISTRIPTG